MNRSIAVKDAQECKNELLRIAQYEEHSRRLILEALAEYMDQHGSVAELNVNMKGDLQSDMVIHLRPYKDGPYMTIRTNKMTIKPRIFHTTFDRDKACEFLHERLSTDIRRKLGMSPVGVHRVLAILEKMVRRNADPYQHGGGGGTPWFFKFIYRGKIDTYFSVDIDNQPV